MTDAPEKIWLTGFVKDEYGARLGRGTISDLDHGTNPEYPGYTRTDLHLALVAAAYLDAANLHQSLWRETSAYKTDQMLKRTPADAQAALEKVKREARNEARREAAELVTREGFGAVHDKILALMEGAGDE